MAPSDGDGQVGRGLLGRSLRYGRRLRRLGGGWIRGCLGRRGRRSRRYLGRRRRGFRRRPGRGGPGCRGRRRRCGRRRERGHRSLQCRRLAGRAEPPGLGETGFGAVRLHLAQGEAGGLGDRRCRRCLRLSWRFPPRGASGQSSTGCGQCGGRSNEKRPGAMPDLSCVAAAGFWLM